MNTRHFLIVLVLGRIWGALLLGERLHWNAFLALIFILAGIAGVNNGWAKFSLSKKVVVEPSTK